MYLKNIFFVILSMIALSIWAMHVSAWIGLDAEDGDILSFTKWNELVAYIDTKVDFLYVDQELSLKQDTIYTAINVDTSTVDLTNYQEGDLIKGTDNLDYLWASLFFFSTIFLSIFHNLLSHHSRVLYLWFVEFLGLNSCLRARESTLYIVTREVRYISERLLTLVPFLYFSHISFLCISVSLVRLCIFISFMFNF